MIDLITFIAAALRFYNEMKGLEQGIAAVWVTICATFVGSAKLEHDEYVKKSLFPKIKSVLTVAILIATVWNAFWPTINPEFLLWILVSSFTNTIISLWIYFRQKNCKGNDLDIILLIQIQKLFILN